jgi:sulfur-carrier protein
MMVKVQFFGEIRQAVPAGELIWELGASSTLAVLLADLGRRFGPSLSRAVLLPDGKLWPTVAVLVNGQSESLLLGLDTPLSEGDVVTILPVITGGSCVHSFLFRRYRYL